MAKPPQVTLTQVERDRLRLLKARFDVALTEYAAALGRADFLAARKALSAQRDIIDELEELIHFRRGRARSRMAGDGRPSKQSAQRPNQHVAWTLVKLDCRVDLVLREHPLGTEVRGMHGRRVLWTDLVTFGPDHDGAVRRAVADARAAWIAKGWHEPAD